MLCVDHRPTAASARRPPEHPWPRLRRGRSGTGPNCAARRHSPRLQPVGRRRAGNRALVSRGRRRRPSRHRPSVGAGLPTERARRQWRFAQRLLLGRGRRAVVAPCAAPRSGCAGPTAGRRQPAPARPAIGPECHAPAAPPARTRRRRGRRWRHPKAQARSSGPVPRLRAGQRP